MRPDLARPGLVPIGLALGVPLSLLRFSLLLALLSLIVSTALLWLASVVTADARRHTALAKAWESTWLAQTGVGFSRPAETPTSDPAVDAEVQ